MNSCQNCKWAYKRIEGQTDHYNYEGCRLGCIGYVPRLPDDKKCDLWEKE